MATIADIRELRRESKVIVETNGGEKIALPKQVFNRLDVSKHEELPEGELESRLEQAWSKGASAYTNQLLSGRVRLSGEIRRKMGEKGYPQWVIEDQLERLRNAGLVDDSRHIPPLVERELEKGYGPKRIVRKLTVKRGADRDEVESAIDDRPHLLVQAFDRALSKKCDADKLAELEGDDYYKYKEKVKQRLARRGFSYDRIKRGLRELEDEKTAGT